MISKKISNIINKGLSIPLSFLLCFLSTVAIIGFQNSAYSEDTGKTNSNWKGQISCGGCEKCQRSEFLVTSELTIRNNKITKMRHRYEKNWDKQTNVGESKIDENGNITMSGGSPNRKGRYRPFEFSGQYSPTKLSLKGLLGHRNRKHTCELTYNRILTPAEKVVFAQDKKKKEALLAQRAQAQLNAEKAKAAGKARLAGNAEVQKLKEENARLARRTQAERDILKAKLEKIRLADNAEKKKLKAENARRAKKAQAQRNALKAKADKERLAKKAQAQAQAQRNALKAKADQERLAANAELQQLKAENARLAAKAELRRLKAENMRLAKKAEAELNAMNAKKEKARLAANAVKRKRDAENALRAAKIEMEKITKENSRLSGKTELQKLKEENARLTQRNQPRQAQKAPPSKVTSWGGRQVIINLDDVMENATVDLWRDFPPGQKFKIAVSNQKPAWMKLSSSAFRRANNALERALNRTGKGRGNKLLARSVLLNVIKGLEKNGLGKDPDSVRRALLKNTNADVLIIADYYEANGGVDMSLQAVRIKDGEIISATRERKLKFGIPR
jgi:hypothetical protein